MPQWISGVLVGVLVAWGTQLLEAFFKRNQYRHEKLMDRYADFAANAVADLERARSQLADMAFGSRNDDYAELMKQIDDKRHSNRLELLRLSLQIRLMERYAPLAQKVEQLAKSQPFMAFPFPPRFGEGNYDKRFDDFRSEVGTFERQLHELFEAVNAKHCSEGLKIGA